MWSRARSSGSGNVTRPVGTVRDAAQRGAFSTVEEAAEGARIVDRDYERQARSGRLPAEEHFDSDVVLTRLLAQSVSEIRTGLSAAEQGTLRPFPVHRSNPRCRYP
jgi:hypothetical protein